MEAKWNVSPSKCFDDFEYFRYIRWFPYFRISYTFCKFVHFYISHKRRNIYSLTVSFKKSKIPDEIDAVIVQMVEALAWSTGNG